MARLAHVVGSWTGTGASEDPQESNLPEGYTSCTDATGHCVLLSMNRPNPNVVMVLVVESRAQHQGYIEALKGMGQYAVLDEWEEIGGVPGEKSKVITDGDLRIWLLAAGLSAEQCDMVTQPYRTERLVDLLRLC